MEHLRHLFPKNTASAEQYTYPRPVGGGEFDLPPRDRVAHGSTIIADLESAANEASAAAKEDPSKEPPKGFCLDFNSDPGFKLQLQSLELRQSGIELRNSRTEPDGVMHATVFVPEGKAGIFLRKFERYVEDSKKSLDKPKNQVLTESIASVRLASLKSFWTDSGEFPVADGPVWWEVWLRKATNPHDAADLFRQRAQSAGVQVSQRTLRFPERLVVLARATTDQLLAIENLFDILAELREAKLVPSDFLTMSPSDQAEFIEDAHSRLQPPSDDSPAVCHLDTGVNRGHPLIGPALAKGHVLAVDPSWTGADVQGHGTEMAGLALYGCLTTILNTSDAIQLLHRLESVKILHHAVANDPDLYGELTAQAASRIEVANPNQNQRVFCLTVTADGRDEGFPSSWSAALDQVATDVEGDGSGTRLFMVSAGNIPMELRHEYPASNQVEGIEDPAQSWNALTVGGYTERDTIVDPEYADWNAIAPNGGLCPASRTSLIWEDKSWPIKPDIVMEGGNNAINPSTNGADFVDDLSLLTTRVASTGAQLTTTGDTSGATALAARYAALIWARYPDLSAESVRAILIHSARWTDAMMNEFPDSKLVDRESRLRSYGFGVPNLTRALSSLSNAATMVIEDQLRPFDRFETEGGQAKIKSKDMHLHDLPWPTELLQELGEVEIRMRITLSYFIEPSPGRRGWTRKHRYQSHGLRFDVKRPQETDSDFGKRISKAAREEDEHDISYGSDGRNWVLGDQLRRKGSIHSDSWVGTAAELATCGRIAVFPVTGWWKERHHLNRWSQDARYALVVSIETEAEEIDLYTPISQQLAVPIETEIETE